jgi:hypothetical protein
MQLSKLVLPVIGVGVLGYGYISQAERDEAGSITGAGDVDAFEIRLGDCFNDASSVGESVEIASIAGVPCTEPHDNEVYALVNLTQSSFPGDAAMETIAFEACLEKFESFVGKDYESSQLDIFPIYPTRQSWNELNDREVVCALYDLDLKKLAGSMRGSRV